MILQTLETDRLVLHPLKVSDAAEMVTVLADESLYEFEGGHAPTLDILRLRYEHQVTGSTEPGVTWWNWIIRSSVDERPLGFVQADVSGECAELGWLVGASDQGRGIATEAAEAVKGWLVRNDIRRIEAHIHPAHTASKTVASRLGLFDTGVIDDDGESLWAADLPIG